MSQLTRNQLWYGRDAPPREPRVLRAGPVTLLLDGRDLREVRYGGLTICDRVYVAVRDRNWGTVPGEPEAVEIEETAEGFAVRFDCTHRQHDIDVTWRGEITGTAAGEVSFAMNAVWNAPATYKLIGFNTHHGMRETAGRPYRGEGPEGPVAGNFPETIFPQFVVDGTEVPVFPAVDWFALSLTDEVEVRFDFSGDPFEVEDQRNWTDASFKAQSFTPRRSGFYRVAAGDVVRQSVTIRPSGPVPAAVEEDGPVRLTIGEGLGRGLPPLGLGMASHGEASTARELDLLRALRLDHLRVDLRLSEAAHVRRLDTAVHEAAALGVGLELALFVDERAADRELSFLAARLMGQRPRVRRVLVYPAANRATPDGLVGLARARLGDLAPNALFAGGTNANFCELNRERPRLGDQDGVVYSINPQIHAFDERSLAENLAPQAATVESARALYGERPVAVSPVTLKQRFNAVATSAEPDPAPGELPAAVDPRQLSLFGAGWTLGSIKYLAEAGAASVTLFETTGWRGVMETEAGSPAPVAFPSLPGMVFPLYHVLADLAEWSGAEIVACQSSAPDEMIGLAMREGANLHLLVANLSPESRALVIEGAAVSGAMVRRLTAENALAALTDPASYRGSGERVVGFEGTRELEPFEVCRIDVAEPRGE